MAEGKQGLVFISCGQYRPEEIKLGEDLAAAVSELTLYQGYFAQNVTSLDGLSRNIFGALNRCCGFVGVMHQRGDLATPDGTRIRASVWVEQEIAIAAFLKQAQDRDIQVVVYVQRGISREGVRDQLHLNPIEFSHEDDVLSDFRQRLSDGRFSPVKLLVPSDATIRFDWRVLSYGGGGIHRYQLFVLVKNTGTDRLTDYWAELQFPKAALDSETIYSALKSRQTATHIVLRANRETVGADIYPDDEIPVMTIDYHMDGQVYRDGSLFELPVIAKLGGPTLAKRTETRFREIQQF
jgi:hypothetical protein